MGSVQAFMFTDCDQDSATTSPGSRAYKASEADSGLSRSSLHVKQQAAMADEDSDDTIANTCAFAACKSKPSSGYYHCEQLPSWLPAWQCGTREYSLQLSTECKNCASHVLLQPQAKPLHRV